LTWTLVCKVSIPLTSITLGTRVGFHWFTNCCILKTYDFILEGPAGLTHEEQEKGLLLTRNDCYS